MSQAYRKKKWMERTGRRGDELGYLWHKVMGKLGSGLVLAWDAPRVVNRAWKLVHGPLGDGSYYVLWEGRGVHRWGKKKHKRRRRERVRENRERQKLRSRRPPDIGNPRGPLVVKIGGLLDGFVHRWGEKTITWGG